MSSGEKLTDWLIIGRESDVVDRSLVTGELVQKLASLGIPHHYTLVTATGGNLCTRGIPAGADEVLLQTDGGTVESSDLTVGRGERSDIPCPDSRIVRVR